MAPPSKKKKTHDFLEADDPLPDASRAQEENAERIMLDKTGSDADDSSDESVCSGEAHSSSADLSDIVEDHVKCATTVEENKDGDNTLTSQESDGHLNHSSSEDVGKDSTSTSATEEPHSSSEDEDLLKHKRVAGILKVVNTEDTNMSVWSESQLKSDDESQSTFNQSDFVNEQLDAIRSSCNFHFDGEDTTEFSRVNQSATECHPIDETTMDNQEIPQVSSTPFKQDGSISSSNFDERISPIPATALVLTSAQYLEYSEGSDEEVSVNSESDEAVSLPEEENSEDSDSASDLGNSFLQFESDKHSDISLSESQNDINFNTSEGSESEICVSNFSKSCLWNDLKLYPTSELSVNEAIVDLMDLFLKNKTSKAGLSRIIDTTCKFLPEDHHLPTSCVQILNYVESLAPPASATAHYFCKSCLFYHGENNSGFCTICQESEFGRFYIFDIAIIINFFFESRNLATIIESEMEKSSERNTTRLKDMKDGSEYKFINRNREKYDLTIILGSDGVRIRKGCNELWLVMFTIAELPIHLQRSFLTVIGVWYHEKKPCMKTFLKPFVQRMESLDHTGLQWTHPISKEEHCSCVRLAVTELDAPARAMVQNTMSFNSRYGCNLCEIKSQLAQPIPNKKTVRVYNFIDKPPLRTRNRMLKQARRAQHLPPKQTNVRGVKGPSILNTIPSADVSKCVVPEYMHCVLIGVTKQLLCTWTKKKTGCLRDKVYEIDRFLKTFKHPDFIHRQIRQLQDLKVWKASDFYYFLLYESLPALHGTLPNSHYQHFVLLVKSIYSLLKCEVSQTEVDEAELLLKLFVCEFKSLYGERAQTHNVHQLLHLALCVRRYGPLYCFSALACEDLNGMISKATHGTQYVDAEIINNIRICQGIQVLKNIVRGQHGLSEESSAYSEGDFLGKEINRSVLAAENLNILEDPSVKIFSRAKMGYDVFTSQVHKPMSSENFYVQWKDENGETLYGIIYFFAQTKDDKFVVIRLLSVDHTQVYYHANTQKSIEQFVPVKDGNKLLCIQLKNIVHTIVKVGKINSHLYVRPNLFRFVM